MSMMQIDTAAETVEQYRRQFAREWRVMAKDPLFAFYGGVDSPDRAAEYVLRRFQEIRRNCTPYLHRPEFMALAEALESAIGGAS